MSTLAGMYFVNGSATRGGQEQGCSMADPDNHGNNLSEDDNTSCSNSELGSEVCNLSLSASSSNHLKKEDDESSSSRRKNKRKNFMPRNIVEYAGSDEEENHNLHHNNKNPQSPLDTDSVGSPQGEEEEELLSDEDNRDDTPLDLSEVQNNSKHLWRKPDFMNASSLSFPSGTFIPPTTPSSFPFSPIDLRLSLNHQQRIGEFTTDDSHLLNHHNPHNNGHPIVQDFTESTMKELLGLYGLAENLRQAGGKPNSTDIPPPNHLIHRHLNSLPNETQQTPNKMMLPESMARLLAAMQDSVNQVQRNQSSSKDNSIGSNASSRSHQNSSPLSNSGHQQSTNQSNVTLKAQLNNLNNNNNQGECNSNNINENTNSSSGFTQHKLHHHRSKGKGTPTGRGLNSFPVIREGLLGKGTGPVDYTRYVRRFGSFSECGHAHCRDLNYREHFHCLECSHGSRVFVKKEEMIRHFKWHKKRDESLQHGFMRYSPSDDCTDRFGHCPHNRKQTHYHCLQDSCEKVYISTSDVQMHANYHRKDSAIIQEGFQRFRAAEDCGSDHCSFRRQHTTHFHCRRGSCSYTFKNKADMEKHKSYHIKDEQLNRDGFKKFMKHEICQYPNCRFSRVCNHIHCIREGCNYVLHSSGQLYSHKRKHERRDSELAYRKFKLAQSVMRGTIGSDFVGLNDSFLNSKFDDENSHHSSVNQDFESGGSRAAEDQSGSGEDAGRKFIQSCKCEVTPEDHFHCRAESCVNALLGTAEVASEHSRSHELENRISSLAYFTVDPANFDAQDSTIPCVSAKCQYQYREKHHHCLWDGCSEVILGTDEPFRRLEHFREHERNQKLEFVNTPTTDKSPVDNLDGFFKRKRGRPPKNRIIEVSSGGSNEAVFTSFKLPKPRSQDDEAESPDMKDPIGFISFPENVNCPDQSCPLSKTPQIPHYHCGHPRCHFSVSDVHKLSLHLRDFHSNVDILDGYEYFDRTHSDCSNSECKFNGTLSHFHCMRDDYVFSRYSNMSEHEIRMHDTKSSMNGGSSDDDEKSWSGINNMNQDMNNSFPISIKTEPGTTQQMHNPMDLSNSNGVGESLDIKPVVTDHSLSRILQLPANPDSSETQFGPNSACGRPFCKLKRKTHFHCHLCNQAFSDLDKLRPHVLKHNNLTPQKSSQESEDADSEASSRQDEDEKSNSESKSIFPGLKIKKEEISYPNSPPATISLSPNPNPFPPTSLSSFLGYSSPHSPYLLFQQNPLSSIYAGMMFGNSSPGFPPPPPHGVLSPPPPVSDPSSPSLGNVKRPSSTCSSPSSPPDKKQRLQLRILKDEPVPQGYVRFRFNEDCAFIHCGYREHQTHFHCTREDCGYSFCDKTRFVQHTARHERLDTLMGGDFKQYRANVPCGRPACSYLPSGALSPSTAQGQAQNKASHFHCSKCEFVCTDTNKVVAHRRQHQKLDSIMAAGFEKFTPSQNCHIDACIHAQKQTHYHCLKCSYAVLGLSQMSAHKYRHTD